MADHAKLQERQVDDDTMGRAAMPKRSASGQPELLRPKGRPPASDESMSGYGPLFEANQQVFNSWCRGVGAVSGEVTRFIQDRWSEDMAAWSALAHCRTPEEAFECQRRFVEKAMTQYAEEIAKLSQLMLTLTTQGVDSFDR